MPFNQDDQRERSMILALGLRPRPDRYGEDAQLEVLLDGQVHHLLFECKSSPEDRDFGTGRDTGIQRLEQWSTFHFVFGWFAARDNIPIRMWYGSPRMMRSWLDDEIAYIEPDLLLSHLVPTKVGDDAVTMLFGGKQEITFEDMHKVMKDSWNAKASIGRPNLYSQYADLRRGRSSEGHLYSRTAALKAVRDRTAYLLGRGATVNNRKISWRYVVDHCSELNSDSWARSLESEIESELRILSQQPND